MFEMVMVNEGDKVVFKDLAGAKGILVAKSYYGCC